MSVITNCAKANEESRHYFMGYHIAVVGKVSPKSIHYSFMMGAGQFPLFTPVQDADPILAVRSTLSCR